MTPLDAAQAIIDARARATQVEWEYDKDYSGRTMGEITCCWGVIFKVYGDRGKQVDNANFTALSANHAAAVAQALIDAEAKIVELQGDWKDQKDACDAIGAENDQLRNLVVKLRSALFQIG